MTQGLGDGLPHGHTTDFYLAVKAEAGENVVLSGGQAMPWYDGPTLIEALELATTRSTQAGG